MLFNDLQVAFEEMEFLVKETGRTHMILHSVSKELPYRVIERHGWANPRHLVAELNCRNVVGDKIINKRRGKKPNGMKGERLLKFTS